MRARHPRSLALLTLAFAATALWGVAQGRIRGTITDEKGKPVADVKITVTEPTVAMFKLETKTDAKGYYALTLLDATRTYTYRFEKEGYQPIETPLKVAIGANEVHDFRILTREAALALNAKTGTPVPTFGKDGIVDLKEGVITGENTPIDLETGEIGLHSTPTVVKDVVIVGSSMKEGMTVTTSNNSKGLVRAFDVRTGKMIWRFNTIPKPGEFGAETWEENSWSFNGNTGVWTQITVDPEAGLVYLPVESPTSDFYGGKRPGNNLFGESLVAVDLKTGVRKWHFQFVHHPIWDHDMSSAPLLMDVTIDGKPRKVVAVPSKQSWLYVFDRITGQPIWPINETPVPQTDMPGEKTAKTQPFPSKPPAFSRTFVSKDDIIDFTPELRAQALKNLSQFRWEQSPFVPPVGPNSKLLGSINIANTTGGVNWPGSGFDPETGIIYTHAHNSAVTVGKYEEEEFSKIDPARFNAKNPRQPRWEADPNYGAPRPGGGAPQIAFPGNNGRRVLGEGLDGLPIVKPPYGLMVAIDMNKGDIKWSVPHGDTPDAVRNHPLLKNMNIPKTGQGGNVGVLIESSTTEKCSEKSGKTSTARLSRAVSSAREASR